MYPSRGFSPISETRKKKMYGKSFFNLPSLKLNSYSGGGGKKSFGSFLDSLFVSRIWLVRNETRKRGTKVVTEHLTDFLVTSVKGKTGFQEGNISKS